MSHLFFTSYARLDDTSYSKLARVVEELRERVRSRCGASSADDVGFFDTHQLEPGMDWKVKMAKAVAHARVLVCFCSNTYFNREFCAKEFEVFRQRIAQAGLAAADARWIIPVIWDRCELPAAVGRYQLADHDFPREYREDGLCALRRQKTKYAETMEALADAICAAVDGPTLPLWGPAIDFDAMVAAFDNPGRYGVRLGVLHQSGLQWSLEPGRTIRSIMEKVAGNLRTPWQEIRVDDQVTARLGEAAESRDVVVLLSDETSVKAAPWSVRLQAIDEALHVYRFQNVSLLIGHATAPAAVNPYASGAAELDAAVRALAPRSSTLSDNHSWFSTLETRSLADKLSMVITKIRMSLIQKDPPRKVENAQLEEDARNQGISIGSRPVIDAPDGNTGAVPVSLGGRP
jgi:hypothetical protein